MMAVTWAFCAVALGGASATVGAAAGEPARSGLFGLGLGLEAPVVGVLTGKGERSDLGSGYTLGAALSWEATPAWVVRLAVQGGETYGSRAPVRYREGDAVVQRRQNAEWFGAGAQLGVAYQFLDEARQWAPFAGAEVGYHFAGYNFRFNEELRAALEPPAARATFDCRGDACLSDLHDGAALSWNAGLRAGVRYQMLRWLSTIADLSVSYAPLVGERISATLSARDVRAVPERLWLVRGTFAVRVGL